MNNEYTYNGNNIKFTKVKNPGTLIKSVLGRDGRISFNGENVTDIDQNKSLINAIDIDWNGAELGDQTINTTDDLLSYIKNNNGGENNPIIQDKDFFQISYFKWSETVPTFPSITQISINDSNISGWTNTALNRPQDTNKTLWMVQIAGKLNDNILQISKIYGPIEISGKNGINGEDSSAREYIYKRFNSIQNFIGYANPVQWNKNQTDDYLGPSGYQWNDHPEGVDPEYEYEYMSWRKKDDNGLWEKFQYPILWSHYGHSGVDGDGVEYVYARTSINVAPTVCVDLQYTGNALTEDEYRPVVTASNTALSGEENYGNGKVRCSDDPKGVNSDYKYEWVLKRTKENADSSGKRKWKKYPIGAKMSLWSTFSEGGGDSVSVDSEGYLCINGERTAIKVDNGNSGIEILNIDNYDEGMTPAQVGSSIIRYDGTVYIYSSDGDWVAIGQSQGSGNIMHIAYADIIRYENGVLVADGFTTDPGNDSKKWIGFKFDNKTKDPEQANEYKWNYIGAIDGNGFEYIFCFTKEKITPGINQDEGKGSKSNEEFYPYITYNNDENVDENVGEENSNFKGATYNRYQTWMDDPFDGVDSTWKFLWKAYRKKTSQGWQYFKGITLCDWYEEHPSYTMTWEAWSNESEYSERIPLLTWRTTTPNNPNGLKYLWRRTCTMKYNDTSKVYEQEGAYSYIRVTAVDAVKISIKGNVEKIVNGHLNLNDIEVGKFIIDTSYKKVYKKTNDGWQEITSENGDCYVNNQDGQLYMFSTEANEWISLGQIQGQQGKTYYTNIAWATSVTLGGNGVPNKLDTQTNTPNASEVIDFTTDPVNGVVYPWYGFYISESDNSDPNNPLLYTWTEMVPGPVGRSSILSTMFVRFNPIANKLKPDLPTEGTYNNYSPADQLSNRDDSNSNTWQDGIPEITNDQVTLWQCWRRFTSDGQNQDSQWQGPTIVSDTETYDVEFSPEQNPSLPNDTNRHKNNSPYRGQIWFDPVLDTKWIVSTSNDDQTDIDWNQMIWKAERILKNGQPVGDWVVYRIKGESAYKVIGQESWYYASSSNNTIPAIALKADKTPATNLNEAVTETGIEYYIYHKNQAENPSWDSTNKYLYRYDIITLEDNSKYGVGPVFDKAYTEQGPQGESIWTIVCNPSTVIFRRNVAGDLIVQTGKDINFVVKYGNTVINKNQDHEYIVGNRKLYLYTRKIFTSRNDNYTKYTGNTIKTGTNGIDSEDTNYGYLESIEFCLSTANSGQNINSNNIIYSCNVGIECEGRKGGQGPQGPEGPTGLQGATGKMFYSMGTWNSTIDYEIDDLRIPMVFYNDGVWNEALGCNGSYYYLKKNTDHTANPQQNPTNTEYWEKATNYGLVMTQGIFAEFAKFGSAIISGDYMFSVNGKFNGQDVVFGDKFGDKPCYLFFNKKEQEYILTFKRDGYNEGHEIQFDYNQKTPVLLKKVQLQSNQTLPNIITLKIKDSDNSEVTSNTLGPSGGTITYNFSNYKKINDGYKFVFTRGDTSNNFQSGNYTLKLTVKGDFNFVPNWMVDLKTGKMIASQGNFILNSDGTVNAGNGNFTIDVNGNVLVKGNLNSSGNIYSANIFRSICVNGNCSYYDKSNDQIKYHKVYYCSADNSGDDEDDYIYGYKFISSDGETVTVDEENPIKLDNGKYYSSDYLDDNKIYIHNSSEGDLLKYKPWRECDQFIPCTGDADIIIVYTYSGNETDSVMLPRPEDYKGKIIEIKGYVYGSRSSQVTTKVTCITNKMAYSLKTSLTEIEYPTYNQGANDYVTISNEGTPVGIVNDDFEYDYSNNYEEQFMSIQGPNNSNDWYWVKL